MSADEISRRGCEGRLGLSEDAARDRRNLMAAGASYVLMMLLVYFIARLAVHKVDSV